MASKIVILHGVFDYSPMRFLTSFFFTCFLTVCISLTAMANPDSHEIIQKIALEELVPVASPLPLELKLPKGWKSQVTDGKVFNFWVPYHKGVMGHLEKWDKPLSFDEALQFIAQFYKTELKEENREMISFGALDVERSFLTARIGGQEYRIFFCVLHLPDKTPVLYYASAPVLWYQTYEPLFVDVLESFAPRREQ